MDKDGAFHRTKRASESKGFDSGDKWSAIRVGQQAPINLAALANQIHAAERESIAEGEVTPVKEVLGLVGDRWTTLILIVLTAGPSRTSVIRHTVSYLTLRGPISQRMLTLKLRRLEANGFLERKDVADAVLHVEYSLTPLGYELASHLWQLIDWVNGNAEAMRTARLRMRGAEKR